MNSANVSRLGGLIALLALVTLPLASCGEASFTGVDVLFELEGAALHKLLVAVAILAALLAIFLVTRQAQVGLGGAGLVATLIAIWMVIGDGSADTQVQIGAWVAVLGFFIVLAAALLQPAGPPPRVRARRRPRAKRPAR